MKKGKLKLEDLTKEELIWYIRENQIDEKRVVSECLFNRITKNTEKTAGQSKKIVDVVCEINELLESYQREKAAGLYEHIMGKGTELERTLKEGTE